MTARAIADLGEVIAVTHITTKQDISRWARAHADTPGINWSVEPGPGGTMLIVEHAHDRARLTRPQVTGRPEFEPCGFRLDPSGSCPRCGG